MRFDELFPRTRRKPFTISIVPLIDVAMFLLIFFLVAGTVQPFEILPINPPIAENGKLMDEGHIVILLGARDEVVVDDDIAAVSELAAMVKPRLQANPNKIITVKADASIPAVRMIHVMDQLKSAGARNLSIVTQSAGGA